MSSLKKMHREFIELSKRPMDFGRLPIVPQHQDVPVLAMDRWIVTAGTLTKRYQFRRPEDRPKFVMALLEYEAETRHNAVLIVDEDAVIVKLTTKTVDRVTELDKEYARFADVVFRDLVYSPACNER